MAHGAVIDGERREFHDFHGALLFFQDGDTFRLFHGHGVGNQERPEGEEEAHGGAADGEDPKHPAAEGFAHFGDGKDSESPDEDETHRAECGAGREGGRCDHDEIIESRQPKAHGGKPGLPEGRPYFPKLHGLQRALRDAHGLLRQAINDGHAGQVNHHFLQPREGVGQAINRHGFVHVERHQHVGDEEIRNRSVQPAAGGVRRQHHRDQEKRHDLPRAEGLGHAGNFFAPLPKHHEADALPRENQEQQHRQHIEHHFPAAGELISDVAQDPLAGPLLAVAHIIPRRPHQKEEAHGRAQEPRHHPGAELFISPAVDRRKESDGVHRDREILHRPARQDADDEHHESRERPRFLKAAGKEKVVRQEK